jgi:hypothetical protein
MVKAIDLKFSHLLKVKPAQAEIINTIMARQYLQAAANLYPHHRKIVNYCLHKAKNLGHTKIEYEGGTFGKVFSRVFGWKLTKNFGYFSRIIKAKLK